MSTNYYKIRIDDHFDHSIITKGHSVYAYCYENNPDGDNAHMHFYLETSLKRASLIARIKSLETFKPGNGFYSCRELQPESGEDKYLAYLAYLKKDGKSHFYGFTSDMEKQITDYNDKVKNQIKQRKASKKTIIEQIIEHYKYEDKPPLDTNQVVTDLIAFYKDQGKLVREFAMVSQVQTLLLRYFDDYSYTLGLNILKQIDKTRM